jgi:predicted  nucleic acid-binding Zn-ribbon protein
MGKALSGTSWQHLDDASNKWECGCLQHVTTNSGDRRKKKPNKLKSYQRKLEDVNQYYEKELITKTQFKASYSTLDAVIDALKELDK